MNIEYKPVPQWPDTFAGSDGHIYSCRRWDMHRLASRDNGRGYLRAQVHGRPRLVHGMVAAAFLGPKPEGMDVNHRDGNKLNNSPANLEYVTHQENVQHAFNSGLSEPKRGASHRRAVLTEEQVATIRAIAANPFRRLGDYGRYAASIGVEKTVVSAVARGKTWRHIK